MPEKLGLMELPSNEVLYAIAGHVALNNTLALSRSGLKVTAITSPADAHLESVVALEERTFKPGLAFGMHEYRALLGGVAVAFSIEHNDIKGSIAAGSLSLGRNPGSADILADSLYDYPLLNLRLARDWMPAMAMGACVDADMQRQGLHRVLLNMRESCLDRVAEAYGATGALFIPVDPNNVDGLSSAFNDGCVGIKIMDNYYGEVSCSEDNYRMILVKTPYRQIIPRKYPAPKTLDITSEDYYFTMDDDELRAQDCLVLTVPAVGADKKIKTNYAGMVRSIFTIGYACDYLQKQEGGVARLHFRKQTLEETKWREAMVTAIARSRSESPRNALWLRCNPGR